MGSADLRTSASSGCTLSRCSPPASWNEDPFLSLRVTNASDVDLTGWARSAFSGYTPSSRRHIAAEARRHGRTETRRPEGRRERGAAYIPCAKPQPRPKTPMTTHPAMNVIFRPKRSARRPRKSRRQPCNACGSVRASLRSAHHAGRS